MSGTIEFRRQTTILKYVPPAVVLTGAEIGQHADDVVVLTFAGYLNENITPEASLFTVSNTTDSVNETISNVSVVNDTVLLTLASDGVYGKVYTVSYVKGGAQVVLTDANSAIIDDFSSYPVTNTVPQGEITAPAFLTTDGYTYGWYEAKADHIIEANSRVRTWNDISGNNHHLTSWMYYNAAVGPVWDAVNEEMDFGMTDDKYTMWTPSFTATNTITVYLVMRMNSWVDGTNVIINDDKFTLQLMSAGPDRVGDIVIYNGNWAFGADNVGSEEYGILTARFTAGNTSILQWNKRDRGIGDCGTETNEKFGIGSYTLSADMSVKEVILRMTADTDNNIDIVQTYLMSKYNIQDE